MTLLTVLIGTTSSGMYRCCWNVVTYKWKIHNGKIEIISFVVKKEATEPRVPLG
jgi:hypothetical protein